MTTTGLNKRFNAYDESGFTLIELLVVILIIGILAAIAIPSFLNQREKGQDTCAKVQVRTMSTALETIYTENNGYTASIADLNRIEDAVTSTGACGTGTRGRVDDNGSVSTYECDFSGGVAAKEQYCLSQTSASGASFVMLRTPGEAPQRLCGPAARQGKGGCPSGGVW